MHTTKDFKTVLETRASKMKESQIRKVVLTGNATLSPMRQFAATAAQSAQKNNYQNGNSGNNGNNGNNGNSGSNGNSYNKSSSMDGNNDGLSPMPHTPSPYPNMDYGMEGGGNNYMQVKV